MIAAFIAPSFRSLSAFRDQWHSMARYELRHKLLFACFVAAGISPGLIQPATTVYPSAGFSLQELRETGPFLRVVVWAPRPGSKGSYEAVLFLHGSQPATIPDPNWFAEIRHYPPFDQKILIVPAVSSAEAWSRPETIDSLRRLLDRVSAGYPVNTRRVFLAGFSSGGFQGFLVASAMAERFAGFASMAATVPRQVAQSQLRNLHGLPVLLVCMELDTAIPCSRQAESVRKLRDAAVTNVAAEQIAGIGHECPFGRVAPVLARWIESVRE